MNDPTKRSIKTSILLGAGASVDAGLLPSVKLTEAIYDRLHERHQRQSHVIFGLIIAKLRVRNVRRGASAFAEIDIEEVYDALLKLGLRDQDILSEFVTGWDPIADVLRKPFDKQTFTSGIIEIANNAYARATRSSTFGVSTKAADAIAQALDQNPDPRFATTVLQPFFRALIDSLRHDAEKVEYMRKLVEFAERTNSVISTLNYDLIVEQAAQDKGFNYDYCLEKWNNFKITQWAKSDIKILKLHGSINWQGDHENINVVKDLTQLFQNSIMIFGGLIVNLFLMDRF